MTTKRRGWVNAAKRATCYPDVWLEGQLGWVAPNRDSIQLRGIV